MSAAAGNDIDELAGEYVLGTLSAAQRQQVEERLSTDANLLTAVQGWQERLLPLTMLAQPSEPSARLWQRIESSLDPAPEKAAVRPSIAGAWHGWWSNVAFWRSLAGAGFAAAVVMAAVLVGLQSMPAAPPAYMVVLLAPQDKSPGWVIQANSTRELSLIPLGRAEIPGDKSLQFWTKGENWNGPVSLGLVKPGQSIRIPLDKLPPLQTNQLFELTLEPVNGSPTGKPTGPIQFIGRAVKVV